MASPPWGSDFVSLDASANCSAYGPYVAWVVSEENEPPFPGVNSFWRAVLPGRDASNGTIIEWHEWVRLNRETILPAVGTVQDCRLDVCRSLGVDLDGELAGVGLLASYGFEALLVTVYCLAAVALHFHRDPDKDPDQSMPSLFSRILHAFHSSVYDLFTAATVLALGVQVVVLYIQTSDSSYAYANTGVMLLVSAFSFFPLAALLPLILDGRRKGIKGLALVVLFIITAAADIVCINNAEGAYDANNSTASLCPDNYPAPVVRNMVMFSMAAMIWIPPLFGLCLACVLGIFRCNQRKMWEAKGLAMVVRAAIVLYSTLSFAWMWVIWILLLLHFKPALQEGTTPQRLRWSFGQVLSLTIWGPVLAELAYLAIFGRERGLSSRLPAECSVVIDETTMSDMGSPGSLRDHGRDDVEEVRLDPEDEIRP